jgi:CheY-like chemotaxis protein
VPPADEQNLLFHGSAIGVQRVVAGLPGRASRVLLVDDDEDSREVVGIEISEWGFEFRAAATGPEALAIAREWRPAIALVDLGLPGMDGYELARNLRALGIEPLKLVAYTGYGLDRHRELAVEAGFDDYLVKGTERGLRDALELAMGGATGCTARRRP